MTDTAERLAQLLHEAGIRHVFGIPGGPWIPYMEAMRQEGVEFVLVSNEASAGFMADVCARILKVPGACYGTLGPGATNLATGVGCAFLDRSPVLAFTNEPPDPMLGRTMQMAVDHQALYRPISKWTARVSAGRLEDCFRRAVQIALSEKPGPVHLGLPSDLGDRPAPKSSNIPLPVPPPPDPAAASLKTAETIFKAARRPILAVGLTAARLGLGGLVVRLAETHRLPVLLTPMAKGLLPEDHPCYAGVLFHALSEQLAETHQEADLVIGIGYDPVEFNYEDWLPNAPLLHLDTEPVDLDRTAYTAAADVVGHPHNCLESLIHLPGLSFEWNLELIAERRDRLFSLLKPPAGPFGPRAALTVLREVLPQDGIMTCDVGAHTHLIGQMWPTPGPGLQIMTNGWSSMGFGVPAAIAAKLCLPEKPVVCVTGDGGFLMMAGEMATASRLGLNVVFLVLVDNELSLIRVKQDWKGLTAYGIDLVRQDYLTVGRLFGARVYTAADSESLKTVLKAAFEAQGPVVVQALVDSTEYRGLMSRKYK